MYIRNILFVIISAGMLFTQACATGPNGLRYIEAFKENSLADSQIAWVMTGRVYEEDGHVFYGADVQVSFKEPDATIPGTYYHCVGLPAGNHEYAVRYFFNWTAGTSYTDWVNAVENFEGGKCYEINATKHEGSGGLMKDYCTFDVKEIDCSRLIWSGLNSYGTVDLYKLGSDKSKRLVELKGSYDVFNDDRFAPYREEFRNGEAVRVTVPFAFINQLYRDLEMEGSVEK